MSVREVLAQFFGVADILAEVRCLREDVRLLREDAETQRDATVLAVTEVRRLRDDAERDARRSREVLDSALDEVRRVASALSEMDFAGAREAAEAMRDAAYSVKMLNEVAAAHWPLRVLPRIG